MLGWVLLACLPVVAPLTACERVASLEVEHAAVPEDFCPYYWAKDLRGPRGLLTVSNGDVLVVERDLKQITVLFDANKNGHIDPDEKKKLAEATDVRGFGLNHGIEIVGEHLYASTPTSVFRWAYQPGDRHDLGAGEVVIEEVPCCHHVSRTLRRDPTTNHLLVQVGSEANVAPNSSHAQIRSFDVASFTSPAIKWHQGELYADGLRNEVGMRFDKDKRLWGVENGVDNLFRADLGGDIHNTNPCEEMNLLHPKGKFFGYPYCWSSYRLPNPNEKVPQGSQYYQPDMGKGQKTDAWCKSAENVKPPAHCFGAHRAPMDIIFWEQTNGFPPPFSHGAYVSFHGSWDREPAAGYNVRHVSMTNTEYMPHNDTVFLEGAGPGATDNWPHRPVGLADGTCYPFGGAQGSCLLIASDTTGVIMAMAYAGSKLVNITVT